MVSWQLPYLAKGCRPDFNNDLRGDSNSVPILAPWRLFEYDWNNGPSPGHLNFVSDGATSVHVSYLWFPGSCHIWPRAAGLNSIMASEVTPIVAPFRHLGVYSSLTGIMAPPRPFQSCVRWSYICSCLLLMVSWQVPYLAKACRPDFNNGLRGDSSSGPILAPGVYSSLSRIMAFPGHLNLVSDGPTSVHVSYLWFPGRCNIWPRAAGLT